MCVAQINIAWQPFIGENVQWAESYLEVRNETNLLFDSACTFPQRKKRHRTQRNNPSDDDDNRLGTVSSDAEGQIACVNQATAIILKREKD